MGKYKHTEIGEGTFMKNVVFCDVKPSSYLTGNILRLRYRTLPVNDM
jgi:hypothetical protein